MSPDEPFNSSITFKTGSCIIINKFVSNYIFNGYNYYHNDTKECLKSCNIDAHMNMEMLVLIYALKDIILILVINVGKMFL